MGDLNQIQNVKICFHISEPLQKIIPFSFNRYEVKLWSPPFFTTVVGLQLVSGLEDLKEEDN